MGGGNGDTAAVRRVRIADSDCEWLPRSFRSGPASARFRRSLVDLSHKNRGLSKASHRLVNVLESALSDDVLVCELSLRQSISVK